MTLHEFVVPKLESAPAVPEPTIENHRLVPSRGGWWVDRLRRIGDVMAAKGAIVVLAPLMLVIAAAVRLSSPGPVFFHQQRVGLDREVFRFWKFRTMYVGADEAVLRDQISREMRGEDTSNGGSWKLCADTRITPVGRFLRRWSLDELPQLLNVFLGTMSLVGPRPCLEWEAEMFAAEFGERFAVRPGLTGLWQVSGRSTMGTREMLTLDVQYVRNRTLLGDIGIVARTLPAVFRVDGAR
jgi:lipopolysaccharide/colanic/teichoic acid biosynthesis glycosyltransferase